MAMAFYVYDGNSQPFWYLGTASFVSAEFGYQGTLSRSTGSGFGVSPHNPAASSSTLVGNVSFRPTSIYDAVLTYNVGNTAITKNVTRIAFSAINYSGSFVGALAGTLSPRLGRLARADPRRRRVRSSRSMPRGRSR